MEEKRGGFETANVGLEIGRGGGKEEEGGVAPVIREREKRKDPQIFQECKKRGKAKKRMTKLQRHYCPAGKEGEEEKNKGGGGGNSKHPVAQERGRPCRW